MHSLAGPSWHDAAKRIAYLLHAESLFWFYFVGWLCQQPSAIRVDSHFAQLTMFSYAAIEIYIASCGPVIVAGAVLDSNKDVID